MRICRIRIYIKEGKSYERSYEKTVEIIRIQDSMYPDELKHIPDPPEILYASGNLKLLKNRKAAVIGSRKVSGYGRWAAENIARTLSENGVTVVSGLACGADSYAHIGALEGEGSTIAVLGTGIDICYPRENRMLMKRIAENGLVISEYPPGTQARRWTFPRRNRIIAGLAECVVVAEAGLASGALITAELAGEFGREVMAVPGNINSIYNPGSNRLIADGAVPLVGLCDPLDCMGIVPETVRAGCSGLGDDEKKIMNVLEKGGELSIDSLSERTGMPPGKVNGIITVLQLKGLVHLSLGKVFVAK